MEQRQIETNVDVDVDDLTGSGIVTNSVSGLGQSELLGFLLEYGKTVDAAVFHRDGDFIFKGAPSVRANRWTCHRTRFSICTDRPTGTNGANSLHSTDIYDSMCTIRSK